MYNSITIFLWHDLYPPYFKLYIYNIRMLFRIFIGVRCCIRIRIGQYLINILVM